MQRSLQVNDDDICEVIGDVSSELLVPDTQAPRLLAFLVKTIHRIKDDGLRKDVLQVSGRRKRILLFFNLVFFEEEEEEP